MVVGQIEGDSVGFEEVFPVGGFEGGDFAHGEFGQIRHRLVRLAQHKVRRIGHHAHFRTAELGRDQRFVRSVVVESQEGTEGG